MSDIDPNLTTEPKPEESPISVQDWIKRFSASEKYMKSAFQPKYKLAKNRLRSETDVKNRNTKKMTHENVNLVYSIGNSFVSSVAFKMPSCSLTAREEVEHERVENTEIKVNDWLKDKKVKKVVQRLIWDTYLGGSGWRFIDHEYADVEDPSNIVEPEIPAQIDPVTGQEIAPGQPAKLGRIVLKNEITIQRIRPDLVRFPRGFDFDNYQESPWIGWDSIMPLSEIKSNENWDEEVRIKIEGEKYEKLSSSDEANASSSDSVDLYAKISFVLVKPENALGKFKLMVFCHKYPQKPLQFIDFDKGAVGYALKPMLFNPLDDDCAYPNGDPWLFESQLSAIDTWWQKMVSHVKRANPKTIYDADAIDKTEVQKLKTANDLEFVGIKNKHKQPIAAYFYEKERAPVPKDANALFEVARQLVSEIGPRSGLSRGSEGQDVDTATEAKIINTGEVIDVEARIDVVREFIVDIVLDVAGILEKSIIAPIPIRKPILDEAGQETGEETVDNVTGEGFTSSINVDVDVESMQAQNKDVYRRQLLSSLEFLLKFEPLMNKIGKTLNPQFWLERIMETMNIRNVEEGIIDLPTIGPIDPNTGQPAPGPAGPTTPPISDGTGMEVKEDAMAGAV